MILLVELLKKDGTPRKYKTKVRCPNPVGKHANGELASLCNMHWEEICVAMTNLDNSNPIERTERMMAQKPITDRIQ